MSSGSFAPDESAFDLLLEGRKGSHRQSSCAQLVVERTNFVGGFLGAIAYGIHVLLFARCVYAMTRNWTNMANYQWTLPFIVGLFITGTINVSFGIKYSEMIWIDQRNFPGGPNAYVASSFSDPMNVACSAGYVVGTFLADGFVLWRCFVIWNRNYVVLVFPTLMYLGSIAMGSISLFQASQPGDSLQSHLTANFLIPFFSLSISINIVVTLLISGYLLWHRRSIQSAIGREHGKQYVSIVAMLVESAALYSAFSLIFIVAYGRNSPVQNLFLRPLAQIQCIAPLLILLRVAYGRAYSGSMSTAAKSTSIGFARAKRPGKSETMVGNAGKDASHEFGSHISLSTLSRAKDVESV